MFIRNLSLQLKPNSLTHFTAHFVKEIVPTLHKQRGFQNALIFGEPGTDAVTAISFWDTKENADLYAFSVYPEMLNKMAQFLDGTPTVRPAELVYSTLSQLATAAIAAKGSAEAKPFAA